MVFFLSTLTSGWNSSTVAVVCVCVCMLVLNLLYYIIIKYLISVRNARISLQLTKNYIKKTQRKIQVYNNAMFSCRRKVKRRKIKPFFLLRFSLLNIFTLRHKNIILYCWISGYFFFFLSSLLLSSIPPHPLPIHNGHSSGP